MSQGRFLPKHKNKEGFNTVKLVIHGKSVRRRVDEMVLESFVGPKPPGAHAKHLNGDIRDDRLVNLEWSFESD